MKSSTFSRYLTVPLATVLAISLAGCGVFGGKEGPKTPTVGNRVPILSRVETSAEPDPALASVTVTVPPQQANADWSQAGGTANKAYGHLALGAAPARLWTASVAGSNTRRRLAAAPVIGGGKLFVMDTQGVVSAFDANTGAPAWQHKFAVTDDVEKSIFGGGASYSDGRVYVTTGVGEVAALDATSGQEVWKVKPAGPLRGAPTIAFNTIFVMTQDNQIHALNATDGKTLWNESGSLGQAGVFGVAAPAAGQGTVIAGYSSGELVAYRYENGRTLWSDALARTSISTQVGILTDIDADPIIDRGRVYALGQGGRMAAYELVTGQRIWELSLASISTPAVAGDWNFNLTDDARLFSIASGTGKVRWVTQLEKFRN
jgi:outer membrane protein assembly factor BamB